MHPFPRRLITSLFTLALTLVLPAAAATEYFVSLSGCDETHDGRSRATAFATVQRGVDALDPGDTLTILPGEYLGGVRRDGLGSDAATTTLRAEIPGTAILRGDVPAPRFEQVAGYRFVYAADFDFEDDIPAVNELDTLTVLQAKPNVAELEFNPGSFHFDRANRKLYLSTSDMHPPATHAYTVSVIATHGLYLRNARRVVVEGLGVTGFNALRLLTYHSGTSGGVWGMFLANSKDCVIRDCRVWLNGWGIGLNSAARDSGDNLIEGCEAWGNHSAFKSGDVGGLTGFSVRRDVIRDSIAYLNGMYGVNIYGTGTDGGAYGDSQVPGNEPENRSRLINNLAWGNRSADVKIKTGVEFFHTVESSVGTGLWSVRVNNVSQSIIGERAGTYPAGNINLSNVEDLDLAAEFADPDHHDYRLQATSRFRGAGPDGTDAGPYPYQANLFYVSPDGDDTADGLSVANAWKTLARAVRELGPGDTLYLAPGDYAGGLRLSLVGEADRPVSLRGRGRGPAIVRNGLELVDCRHLNIERVQFEGAVRVGQSHEIAFSHCRFAAPETALELLESAGLKLVHCTFQDFAQAGLRLTACSALDLRGNWFDNRQGVAVVLNEPVEFTYAGYNGYHRQTDAWQRDGEPHPHRAAIEHFAFQPYVQASESDAVASSVNRHGPFGRPQGPYHLDGRTAEMRMTLAPVVHSVSATTANLEWMTSMPAGSLVAWGETPECENRQWMDIDHFGTFSLTGLEPGRTYYFTIKALREPSTFRQRIGMHESPPAVATLDVEPLAFTTRAADAPPRRYFVAPDGDDANSGLGRQHAWRTLQQAADAVGVGDTVWVAGGDYAETVRLRATGAPEAPITFAALPGEQVMLNGAKDQLSHAFVVSAKSHLRFDGFYLRDYNLFGGGAEFQVYRGRDISISRCFSDGRGGYSASFLHAVETEDLVMENCVALNKMGGVFSLDRSPNASIRHNVFVRPMISTFTLNNASDQPVRMHNNLFTDMMEKKAKQNIKFAELEAAETLKLDTNGFFVRSFPHEERMLFAAVDHAERRVTADYTRSAFDAAFGDSGTIFGDPLFAGDPGARDDPADKGGFSPDRFMNPRLDLDFNAFFATHPDFVQRGIGLQPEAFADFHFNRED